jgi:hypothetical protein
MSSALLDTSFLITLVDAGRPQHEVAHKYYRQMLDEHVDMYFSTIAASEFAIKQPITDLPLKNFRTIPFNIIHSVEAAKLWNLLSRDSGDSRHIVRDDVKLIAQASKESISFILTEDAGTLYKYCDRLRVDGFIQVRPIKLIEGFDSAALKADGQRGLALDV